MPRRRSERPGQLAGYWLSKRPGSPMWHRTWRDSATRQTRRASLGAGDLAAAERALAEWITQEVATSRADPRDVTLGRVFARYHHQHGKHTVGAGSQRISLAMILRGGGRRE